MRKKIYPEEKCEIVRRVKAGEYSQRHAAELMGVHVASLQAWIRIYESEGPEGFSHPNNKSYSDELKLQAVKEYLDGQGSISMTNSLMPTQATQTLLTFRKRFGKNTRKNSRRKRMTLSFILCDIRLPSAYGSAESGMMPSGQRSTRSSIPERSFGFGVSFRSRIPSCKSSGKGAWSSSGQRSILNRSGSESRKRTRKKDRQPCIREMCSLTRSRRGDIGLPWSLTSCGIPSFSR